MRSKNLPYTQNVTFPLTTQTVLLNNPSSQHYFQLNVVSLSPALVSEGRKMTDINRRLQHNSVSQKQAKQAAEYLELDRQGKEIEERGQVRA